MQCSNCLGSLDKKGFHSKQKQEDCLTLNSEELKQLNFTYDKIFNSFQKIDQLTSNVYQINKNNKKKKELETKNHLEHRLHGFLNDIKSLDFDLINEKLVELEVDNLFGVNNDKILPESKENNTGDNQGLLNKKDGINKEKDYLKSQVETNPIKVELNDNKRYPNNTDNNIAIMPKNNEFENSNKPNPNSKNIVHIPKYSNNNNNLHNNNNNYHNKASSVKSNIENNDSLNPILPNDNNYNPSKNKNNNFHSDKYPNIPNDQNKEILNFMSSLVNDS